MRFISLSPRQAATFGVALAAFASLAACAGGGNPVRDIAAAVGAGPKVAETPDFVASSRRGSLEYMPVGTSRPGRPTPARTAEEIKAAEAELDAVRAQNEAAGAAAAQLGGTPPPQPATLPAARTAPSRNP